MGIFGRRIDSEYAAREVVATLAKPPAPPLSIASPWSPQDTLVTFALDALGLKDQPLPLTREVALRIPAVKRAHGVVCTIFAGIPFRQMNDFTPVAQQPSWLTSSDSGVAPYHRMFGMASDWFFNGWACLAFKTDMSDALHIPYGLWKIEDDGTLTISDERVRRDFPEYSKLVAIPLGYGENGMLIDGADTLAEARQIEAAYRDRLDNPVPLTILGIPRDVWEAWDEDERKSYRDQWVEGRKVKNGATAMKVAEFPVDMPGQVAVDLYESGRNAVRLDIANHSGVPASLVEGVRQGGSGGGVEMNYNGVQNGATRSDFWDFGLPRRMTLAFEARMSLDDICRPGESIRGDLTNMFATPAPNTNPTSQD